VQGVPNLLLTQLLIVGSSFLTIYIWFKSEPPTPPSKAAAQLSEKLSSKGNSTNQTKGTIYDKDAMRNVAAQLFKSKNYNILFVTFTLSLGHLNAAAALLGQLPGI
jgi:hypothetical protein